MTTQITNTQQYGMFVMLNGMKDFQGNSILAAGPLIKQPHTKPYRIVLVDKGTELVVYDECLKDDNPDLSQPITCGSYYHQGNYFRPDIEGLAKAYERFAERLVKEIKYVPTISRMVDPE